LPPRLLPQRRVEPDPSQVRRQQGDRSAAPSAHPRLPTPFRPTPTGTYQEHNPRESCI
jgi:hypothetical protein